MLTSLTDLPAHETQLRHARIGEFSSAECFATDVASPAGSG